MVKRRWWLWAVIAGILLLIGWASYVSSKQIERNQRIQDEIKTLQTEADKIHRENETLSEKISYFASDDFREQEAKKKLGLKKTEETVVEVKPTSEYEKATDTPEQQALSGKSGDENVANYKKWWNVFFGTY